MYNLDGRIGGDTALSPRGEQYARKLPELVRKSVGVSVAPPPLLPSDWLGQAPSALIGDGRVLTAPPSPPAG